MAAIDVFQTLSRFYDPIMQHVDYDRWYLVAGALSQLLPRPFLHLDTACGTGRLLKKLRVDQWRSFGADLSFAMLQAGARNGHRPPMVCADLRALPLFQSVDYVTCLFDSVNFLTRPDDMRAGIREMAHALRPQGILYFDIVTERMVLDHFADQEWVEEHGGFSTRWSCEYDRRSRTAELRIRINNGDLHTLYERVYAIDEIEAALRTAGCELMGAFDAQTWRRPKAKTVRIDVVAVRGSSRPYARPFRKIQSLVRGMLS